MKKSIKLLLLLCVTLFSFGSCVENDPTIEDFARKDADFYYTCPSINYVIKEEISFMNTSLVGTTYKWDFGDNSTSTEENPVHKYELPGTYTVVLTIDEGKYVVSKKIMISDIIPVIMMEAKEGLDKVIYNQTPVSFDVYVDNPEKVDITYNWTFPQGTKGEGISANGKSSLKQPKVIFDKFGTQVVGLQVSLGDKVLETIVSKVKVNYDKPAKSLYYAVKNGNMMCKKLVDDVPSGVNNPFDTGYKSGKHVLSMQFSGDWLYAFDAGTKTGYAENPAGLGDGEIFAISSDWKKRELIMENYDGDTFMDFYYGYVDEETDRIYFLDRREGIRWIPTKTRNAKFSETAYSYWVTNERLGYYGHGITWGNTNGPLFKYNGMWHWAKNSTGKGIFRFTEGDIDKVADVPTAGALYTIKPIRGIAVDPVNKKIYFSDNSAYKMWGAELETEKLFAMFDNSIGDGEGGTAESLFVTGMAIDLEGGYLYWAYRGPQPVGDADEYYKNNPLAKSGIKRIKLSDINGTNCQDKIEYFIEGVEAYGLAIDQTAR